MKLLMDPILGQRWMEGGRILSCPLSFIALPTWKHVLSSRSLCKCSHIFFRIPALIGLQKQFMEEIEQQGFLLGRHIEQEQLCQKEKRRLIHYIHTHTHSIHICILYIICIVYSMYICIKYIHMYVYIQFHVPFVKVLKDIKNKCQSQKEV